MLYKQFGWTPSQGAFQIQKKKKDEEEQFMTPAFPGFSDAQVKWMVEQTKDLEPTESLRAQQQMYQDTIPFIEAEKRQTERLSQKNQIYHKAIQTKDKEEQSLLMAQYRIADFADMVREREQKRLGYPIDKTDDEIVGIELGRNPKLQESFVDYLNNGNKDFLEQMGLIEPPTAIETAKQIGTDIVGGAYDSVTGLPKFVAQNLAKGVGRIAKKLGADEERVQELVDSYLESLKDFSGEALGADTESTAYGITKGVGDIVQTMTASGLARGTAKGAELVSKVRKLPLLGRMVAGGIEGVADTMLFNAISEQEIGEPAPIRLGGAIGATIPGAGALVGVAKKGIQKVLPKLQLSGLLNTAKLTQAKNLLLEEGSELAGKMTQKDVGTWMIERGVKGDKTTIINQLSEHGKKSKQLVDELLTLSESKHKLPVAKKALEQIQKDIGDTPGMEAVADRISDLLNKGEYNLSEVNQIKREMDNIYNLYKQSGGETSGLKAEGLRNIRKELKTFIEDVAKKERLGNIKMLNNETQMANTLADAISKKESADVAREMLSVFSKGTIGGFAGYQAGPFDKNTLAGKAGNIIIGALAGKYLFSTKAKTTIANKLGKLTKLEQKSLERFIATEGAEKLSKNAQKKMGTMVEELVDEGVLIPNKVKDVSAKTTTNLDTSASVGASSATKGSTVKSPTAVKETAKKTVNESIPELKATVKAPEVDTSYRIGHQIDTKKSSPITSIDGKKIDTFVDEFKRQYGYPALKSKDLNKFKQIMKNPDADIKIYRASPKNELNKGDWVTIDKTYANDIKRQNGGKVYEYNVKAKDLLYPNTIEGFNELPSLNKWGAFQYNKGKGLPVKNESIPQLKATVKAPDEALLKEARKYKSADDFVEGVRKQQVEGQRGWSAPSGHGESLKSRLEYDGDVTLREELTKHIKQPDDYFHGYLGPKKYGNDSKTITAIKKGMEDGEITIYRAVPKGINTWRDGDWVYFVKDKAKLHGDNALNGKYDILEKKTSIDNVWRDGNDINEWGFDDGSQAKQLKQIREEANK